MKNIFWKGLTFLLLLAFIGNSTMSDFWWPGLIAAVITYYFGWMRKKVKG